MTTKRIILVDDETYITTTLAAKFRGVGHQVDVANDGEEGFALISKQVPDLVITDFQMPVLSGFEMSRKLFEQPATSNVPVIMLTARGHLIAPTEITKTNIRALFSKPFSARELLAKVEELFASGCVQ